MEERGWGLGKMRDSLMSHGLPPPQFSLDSGYFIVTFLAQKRVEGAVVIDPVLMQNLNDHQKSLVDFIRKNGRASRGDLATEFKLSPATTKRALSALVTAGILETRGQGSALHYVLHTG